MIGERGKVTLALFVPSSLLKTSSTRTGLSSQDSIRARVIYHQPNYPMSMALQISYIIGPLLAAVIFNAFLFGICVMQFTTYITSGFRDRLTIRLIIYWALLLDALHSACVTWMLWFYVVENYNNLATLAVAPWAFPSIPIFTHFLAWRIKTFTSSKMIFASLSFLSLTQGALAIISASLALSESNITDFYIVIPTVDTWNVISVICDIAITYLLAKHLNKSRTGNRSTDSVITKIIIQSIETAAFPLIFCVMDFVTFTVIKDTTFHLIFGIPMGRVYTNTLLLTLNSRMQTRMKLSSGMRGTNIRLNTITRSSLDEPGRDHIECEDIHRPEIAAVKPVHREIVLPSAFS